jgi:hypothetical protein
MVCILVQPLIQRICGEEPLASELPRRDIAPYRCLAKCLGMDTELFRHLLELLRAWEAEEIDATQVRDTAEQLESAWDAWQELDRTTVASVPPLLAAMAEMLTTLSDLHIRLVTRSDIPAMVECLRALDQDPVGELAGWVAYSDGVDWKARGRGGTTPSISHIRR